MADDLRAVNPRARLFRTILSVYGIAIYIFLFAPIAVLILLSFNSSSVVGFPMAGFTTPVVGAQRFWPAGEEHQNYAKRHAASYQAYRIGCRRPERLRAIWGDAAVS